MQSLSKISQKAGSGVKVPAITTGAVLDRVSAKRINFLKLDIEGSELQLSYERAERWIDEVEVIAIELHDRFRLVARERSTRCWQVGILFRNFGGKYIRETAELRRLINNVSCVGEAELCYA